MARYKLDRRITEFESCAKSLKWAYKEIDDFGLIKLMLDFKLFKRGTRKKICPLIVIDEGNLEYTCVFDYTYTISTGKSSTTYRQTVYFRYSKLLALPHFVMVPEKWYHRIGTYFGMQDIDFVEYPAFSHNYLLQGEDEDYIRYHFDHPEMIKFFDNQSFYSLEGMNYLMILYIDNTVLPTDQMKQLVRIGNALHNYLADKTPDIHLPEFEEDNIKLPDLPQ